jgi:hypothetical protein
VTDLYTLNDCLPDGWMDVWMDDTLKASPTWTFLSFLQEQFSLQSKEITLQNG